MFIKTQDGQEIINLNYMGYVTVTEKYYCSKIVGFEVCIDLSGCQFRWRTVGIYETEDRAEEVMNEIINCCIAGIDMYNMPEK